MPEALITSTLGLETVFELKARRDESEHDVFLKRSAEGANDSYHRFKRARRDSEAVKLRRRLRRSILSKWAEALGS